MLNRFFQKLIKVYESLFRERIEKIVNASKLNAFTRCIFCFLHGLTCKYSSDLDFEINFHSFFETTIKMNRVKLRSMIDHK